MNRLRHRGERRVIRTLEKFKLYRAGLTKELTERGSRRALALRFGAPSWQKGGRIGVKRTLVSPGPELGASLPTCWTLKGCFGIGFNGGISLFKPQVKPFSGLGRSTPMKTGHVPLSCNNTSVKVQYRVPSSLKHDEKSESLPFCRRNLNSDRYAHSILAVWESISKN